MLRYYAVDGSLNMNMIDFAWVSHKVSRRHGEHYHGILSRYGRVYDVFARQSLLPYNRASYHAVIIDCVSHKTIANIDATPDTRVYFTAELAARDALAIACDAMLVVTAPSDTLTPPLF